MLVLEARSRDPGVHSGGGREASERRGHMGRKLKNDVRSFQSQKPLLQADDLVHGPRNELGILEKTKPKNKVSVTKQIVFKS